MEEEDLVGIAILADFHLEVRGCASIRVLEWRKRRRRWRRNEVHVPFRMSYYKMLKECQLRGGGESSTFA